MSSLLKRPRRLIGLCLAVVLLTHQSLPATRNWRISEKDYVDLSVRAFSKDKKALRELLRSYLRYRRRRNKTEIFSRRDQRMYMDLVETLHILIHYRVVDAYKELSKRGWRVTARVGLPYEVSKYFSFEEGAAALYRGMRKTLESGRWIVSDRVLKVRVLDVSSEGNRQTEALVLHEIFDGKGERLAEQVFETYQISEKGVRVRRNVTFREPRPGTFARIGRQDAYWLVKFPLAVGESAGTYKIEDLDQDIVVSSRAYSDCLVLSSTVRKLVIAPGAGLIRSETYGERWDRVGSPLPEEILMPGSTGTYTIGTEFPPHEIRRLRRRIKRVCRSEGLRLESFLSLAEDVSSPEVAVARLLVYRKLVAEPEQRRFKVVVQRWARNDSGDGERWVRLLPPEPEQKEADPRKKTSAGTGIELPWLHR